MNLDSRDQVASKYLEQNFWNRLPAILQKMVMVGVNTNTPPRMARNIIVTNFAAYFHALMTLPYYWVFKAFDAIWLDQIVVVLTILFLLIPKANKLGYTNFSRIGLVSIINFCVYIYTASIGMQSSIQNVFFFTIVSPFLLFQSYEWRKIIICVIQPILLWALLFWKGSWIIPQTYFSPTAFAFMSPTITLTTGLLLFGCLYLISILQKNSEEKLKKAKEFAEASNRSKTEFLATMSHEVRTPMNGIFSSVQMLQDTNPTQEQYHELHLIKSASDLLLAILNDILDIAKMETGKLIFERKPFNLAYTLKVCKQMMEKNALEKGIDFQLKLNTAQSTWILGDENRIRQVIMNLANNAIKFTEHGSVSIDLMPLEAGEKLCVCSVLITDTGIGIKPEMMEKLFKPFQQVDSSNTRVYGGTGLGLAISKRLAEAMAGNITVTSTYGVGSAFTFSFTCEITQPPNHGNTGLVNIPSLAHFAGKKALVVEDNPANQTIVAKQLSKLGFEIVVANHGEQAIEICATQKFDVILMDCQMPVMDGYEATKALRKMEKSGERNIIIALTANALPENRELCLSVGMDDFLTKPLLLESLRTALKKHLQVSQPSKEA